jgi:DNA repair photolyase
LHAHPKINVPENAIEALEEELKVGSNKKATKSTGSSNTNKK